MEGKLRLSIEGMHCGSCVRRVTAALEGIKGVEVGSVEVGSAQVGFDPEHVSMTQITKAVNCIGFSAHVVR
jgi:copper chaperone